MKISLIVSTPEELYFKSLEGDVSWLDTPRVYATYATRKAQGKSYGFAHICGWVALIVCDDTAVGYVCWHQPYVGIFLRPEFRNLKLGKSVMTKIGFWPLTSYSSEQEKQFFNKIKESEYEEFCPDVLPSCTVELPTDSASA